MREHEPLPGDSEEAILDDRDAQGDLRKVLAALQKLIRKTGHPIVRACLESVYDDIMHLAAHGEEEQANDGEPAAA
jgi:hypothetical protein